MAGEWLTEVLGKKCRLVRQNPHHRRKVKHGHIPDEKGLTLLSLANEAQYLMLSQSSLEQLLADISRNQPEWMGVDVDDLAIRFRANFVVGKGKFEVEPFVEEKWREIRIGDHLFQVDHYLYHALSLFDVHCMRVSGDREMCEMSNGLCGS